MENISYPKEGEPWKCFVWKREANQKRTKGGDKGRPGLFLD